MKLLFKKETGKPIQVYHDKDGEEVDYSYVDMIKTLMQSRHLEDPRTEGEFSDAEIKSINSMVSFINNEIKEPTDESTTEEDVLPSEEIEDETDEL